MRDSVDFNQKYGKLTILKEVDAFILPSGQPNRAFECLCECGNKTKVRWLHLKRGRVNSCGCICKTKKGYSNSIYGILLNSMRTRCKEDIKYNKYYHLKGITICDEWLNDIQTFVDFCKNNGYKKGLQIDRIDNLKGYSPENCRFVTQTENMNNRDNTSYVNYKGEKIALKVILRKLGKEKDYYSIRTRIMRGQSPESAIDNPIRTGNYNKVNCFKKKIVL
jgi:hypothetical protein